MGQDRAAEPATRRPSGRAAIVGFADAHELLAAMVATTHAAIEAAISERLFRQSISDRGDAAATLFLDAARVESLLHGPGEPPPALTQLRTVADRRLVSLQRRLEATADAAAPLAHALRRWRLSPDATAILLHAISIELTPRLARLAAFLGGDASRAGVVVEAMGALLDVEERGIATVARSLAAGDPLHDLAVVLLRNPELPLLRRSVWLPPRVVELALGRLTLDDQAGGALVAVPPTGSGPDTEARSETHAVLRRPAARIVGVLRGGALASLARVLADIDHRLIVTELSSLADEIRLAAIAREAALFDAAIAVRVDVIARDAARAARAIDRLAALAPVFLVSSGDLEPALPLTVGVVSIRLPAPSRDQLAAAIVGTFPQHLTAGDATRAAALAALDLGAVCRAAAVIAAQPFSFEPVGAVTRAIADQLAPAEAPGLRALRGPIPSLAPSLDLAIEAIAERWSASQLPRRLRVIIDGRAGTGKTTVAAAIAARLGLTAFATDPARAMRGADQDPALASVIAAVVANGAALVVENADLLGARRTRVTNDPPFSMIWLGRVDGLVIVTTRDPLSNLEPSLRREFDLTITIPFPDLAERRRLWAGVLARQGAPATADELDLLARDFPFSAIQIERVAALAATDVRGLRAEAERRSRVIAGVPSGVEVE